MTSILSKQELMDTNLIMLGKGAPIDIDGIGYNKVDYSKMAYLSTKSDLTDSEAYVLSSVLLKYTTTQLVHIAAEIKATIAHYQKLVKEVKVVDFNRNSIQLSWNFNQAVSSHIKTMDRSYFKWLRPNGEWVLDIQWSYLQQLMDVFTENGFGIATVQIIWDNLDSLLEDKDEPEPTKAVKISVSRPSTTIDTLVIDTEYNPKVVDAFRRVPYTFFKSNKTWEFYIEYAAQMYRELDELKIGLDLSELKPWSDMVKG